MKKSILMLGLAVAAMTSCTNDEVLEQAQSTQKAIGFESFVNKTTKAIGATTSPGLDNDNQITGLKKFYAYGFHGTTTDFNGVTVTGAYDTESGNNPQIKWTHDGAARYWSNATYYFAAYADGNNGGDLNDNVTFSSENSLSTLSIPNYTVDYTGPTETSPATTSDATDLVAAITSEDGTIDRTAKVNFTFKHLLSKIQFKVYNNNNQGLTVKITNVIISNVKATGSFSSSYKANWSPAQTDWTTSGSAITNFIPIAACDLAAKDDNENNDEVLSEEFYVIPQTFGTTDEDKIKVTFTADYYQGTSLVQTQDVDLFIGEDSEENSLDPWKPGYSYIYNIGLPSTANPIEFGTPTVGTWTSSVITLL